MVFNCLDGEERQLGQRLQRGGKKKKKTKMRERYGGKRKEN